MKDFLKELVSTWNTSRKNSTANYEICFIKLQVCYNKSPFPRMSIVNIIVPKEAHWDPLFVYMYCL